MSTPLCLMILQIAGLLLGSFALDSNDWANNPDVKLFQRYLRINTTTLTSELKPAVSFWTELSKSLDLDIKVLEFKAGQPVIVIKWPGKDPSLKSIMLSSHMDVVPTRDDEWHYPPFGGILDDEGVIWGRGTQDMKSVSIQYYLALKRLKEKKVSLLRDVYMTLMPDEEIGGPSGMQLFVKSAEFEAMNVGCAMDEGGASRQAIYPVFYQDKAVWQIRVNCSGVAVHSATFPATKSTATGKCINVINSLQNFRESQFAIATKTNVIRAGAFTVINLNKWNGGTANNVVPSLVSLVFDIRLATSVNTTEFEEQLIHWLSEAGDNVTMEFLEKDVQSAASVISDKNPYFVALQLAAHELNIRIVPIVSPGATDGRYLRLRNVPAFGFSPMAQTPILAHTSNERLSATTFTKGIHIYESIITNLANIPAERTRNLDGKSLVKQSEYA